MRGHGAEQKGRDRESCFHSDRMKGSCVDVPNSIRAARRSLRPFGPLRCGSVRWCHVDRAKHFAAIHGQDADLERCAHANDGEHIPIGRVRIKLKRFVQAVGAQGHVPAAEGRSSSRNAPVPLGKRPVVEMDIACQRSPDRAGCCPPRRGTGTRHWHPVRSPHAIALSRLPIGPHDQVAPGATCSAGKAHFNGTSASSVRKSPPCSRSQRSG